MAKKIIRTYSAGVFYANVKSRKKDEVVLTDSRRIWYWDGAASLSELAMRGVAKPDNCKISVPVSSQIVLGVIEIIDTTPQARKSLDGVKQWEINK